MFVSLQELYAFARIDDGIEPEGPMERILWSLSNRLTAWCLACYHECPAVRWASLPAICISIPVIVANWSPDIVSALPLSYNVLVSVFWLFVLHVFMPACMKAREVIKAETEALARRAIPGAELDDDMCFTAPHLREMFWHATRKSRETHTRVDLLIAAVPIFPLFVSPDDDTRDVETSWKIFMLAAPFYVVTLARHLLPSRIFESRKATMVISVIHSAALALFTRAVVLAKHSSYSNKMITCIANYFSYAVGLNIGGQLWMERSASWKLMVLRMSVCLAMDSYAMFERWAEKGDYAGFRPPADPDMLCTGLHVLPFIAATNVACLISYYIQSHHIRVFVAAYTQPGR